MKHLQQQTPTLDSLSNKIAHRLKGKKLDAEVLEKVGNTKIPGYRNRRCPQGSPVGIHQLCSLFPPCFTQLRFCICKRESLISPGQITHLSLLMVEDIDITGVV